MLFTLLFFIFIVLAERHVEYDIIHGNELLGVQPGQSGDKPSDHAYVIAKIRMG